MFENHMELSFDSISQNESFARAAAAAFITQLNPTIEELSDIRTAVSEAVTNAVVHGYGNDPSKTVHMACSIRGDIFEVTVWDEGRGMEKVALAMQPFYTTMPGTERSGMGFSVMEAFMDGLTVESEPGRGTKVTMTKAIRPVRDDE